MPLDGLQAGDLTIEAETGGDLLTLRWRGKCNDRNPERVLAPFFARALDQAVADAAGLELRFEQLDHFNSSTIGYLIQLIQETRRRNVRMRLVYDAARNWQKLSFEALALFATEGSLLELRTT
jgi:hypothetical protein